MFVMGCTVDYVKELGGSYLKVINQVKHNVVVVKVLVFRLDKPKQVCYNRTIIC